MKSNNCNMPSALGPLFAKSLTTPVPPWHNPEPMFIISFMASGKVWLEDCAEYLKTVFNYTGSPIASPGAVGNNFWRENWIFTSKLINSDKLLCGL